METQTQPPPPTSPLPPPVPLTATSQMPRPPSKRSRHSGLPTTLLQAAVASAAAKAAANGGASPDMTDDELEPREQRARRMSQGSVSSNVSLTLLDHLVHTVFRLSATAGMQESASKPVPRDSDHTLHWLVDELERINIHLQRRPSRSDIGSVVPRRRSRPGSSFILRDDDGLTMDGLDALDGLEDCKVDSEDDILGIEQNQANQSRSRRSSSKRSRRISRGRSSNFQNLHGNLPPVLELPIEDDGGLSARSSQAQLEGRPPPRLPLGSAANSYITHMSLDLSDSTKLHADYNKLFHREDATPLAPGESLIAIAAGNLYRPPPIRERWDIREKIGEGGYSTVHIATIKDPVPGDLCMENIEGNMAAIKIISKKRPELYNEKMVTREVFSFRLLKMAGGHDNIVEVFEVSEDNNNVYIVMELLAGGDLFASIAAREHYTERDAANLVVSMLAGLACCHRLNLTHRDVKPENFVFKDYQMDDAELKLTDFGIAHYSEDPSALCKTLCGTPLYVAPEVLLRQPYGPDADLWSLGVIVYIMLVGYPPFDDNDIVQLVKKIKYRPVTFDGPEWVLISDEGKKFLANLLDKDRSNRMTAQQALEHEWVKDNCQAATKNVLEVAQTNIKSFVNRKRWKAAIQGVKAMNRIHKMVELARDEEERHIQMVVPPEERIEVVSVKRPDPIEPAKKAMQVDDFDDDITALPARQSSSSGDEGFVTARRTPLSGSSSRSGRPPPRPRFTSTDRKRSSSVVIQKAAPKAQLRNGQDNGTSMVLVPTDPAFESSGELTNFQRQRVERAPGQRLTKPPFAGRMESTPYIGSHTTESESGRVGRSISKYEGSSVVRKMSTHARKLVSGKGRRTMGGDRPPVLEMGEQHRRKKFPWFNK